LFSSVIMFMPNLMKIKPLASKLLWVGDTHIDIIPYACLSL
jgi:hypothetical protein